MTRRAGTLAAAAAAEPSVQSRVIAAAVGVLNAWGAAPAYRTRMTALQLKQLPAYNVLPERGDTEYDMPGATRRTFRFEVRHTAAANDEVDAAVDPLYVASVRALLADPTLGGLVTSLHEREQKWDLEKGDLAVVALVVTFEAEFTTPRKDPSAKLF